MSLSRYGNYDWMQTAFSGEDVYVLASGDSLNHTFPGKKGKGPDFSILEGKNVIAINHTLQFAPHAKVWTFLDSGVTNKMGRDHYSKPYRTVTSNAANFEPRGNVSVVRTISSTIYGKAGSACLSLNPADGLWCNYSTGIFAISIALSTAARKIYLLGFDGQCTTNKPNFYDTQKVVGYMRQDHPGRLERMLKLYSVFHPVRDRVVNLNPGSAIDTFDKADPKEHF